MASAIEDVSSLPGETVHDQEGRKLGEVKEIYAVGNSDTPMWVTVEISTGMARTRPVFIPIARLKQEGEEIRTPYSFQHLQESPEVETGDDLSEEDDRTLRVYYAIGLADQEMVEAAQSYASQVPDEEGAAQKADPGSVEGQVRELDEREPGEAAREADEADREREGDEGEGKARKATADDVLEDKGGDGGKDESRDEPESQEE